MSGRSESAPMMFEERYALDRLRAVVRLLVGEVDPAAARILARADVGELAEERRRLLEGPERQQLPEELGARVLSVALLLVLVIFAFGLARELAALHFHEPRGHEEELGDAVDVDLRGVAQALDVAVGDPCDGDVVDVDLLPLDEVEEEVEGAAVVVEFDAVVHEASLQPGAQIERGRARCSRRPDAPPEPAGTYGARLDRSTFGRRLHLSALAALPPAEGRHPHTQSSPYPHENGIHAGEVIAPAAIQDRRARKGNGENEDDAYNQQHPAQGSRGAQILEREKPDNGNDDALERPSEKPGQTKVAV
jgi:hypothetical protein